MSILEMQKIKKPIRIRIQDGKPFYFLRPNPLIRACKKREEFHKQMLFTGLEMAKFSLKMIYWNNVMIDLIKLNQWIKKQTLPFNIMKESVEINEKILNELNADLTPNLYKWLKPEQYNKQNYRLVYVEFHDERPPEEKTHSYILHKVQRMIEIIIRKSLGENDGVPSLKAISIFTHYRAILRNENELTYSLTLNHNFSNDTLLD